MAPDPHTDPNPRNAPADAVTPSGTTTPAAHPVARIQIDAADILENVRDAFLALDRDWRILYANREACRINQKPLEAFVGRKHWEEWPAAVGTELERQFRRAMTERVEAHFEHHYVTGLYDVWTENDVYPSEQGINLFYRDITARKRAEEALRESERRFREMADAIPHIAWISGPDGAVDYYNRRWHDYSGLGLGQTQGWGWEAVIHPDDLERAGGAWQAAIRAGTVSEVEYRLRRADGEYRLHLGRSQPVRDGEKIVRWVGTATDIEDRQRAEEELRRSREDLRLAVDAARIGTFYCDWPLDRIVWNETCKDHFFLPHDAEVDFALFYSLLHPDDREPTRRAIERATAERVGYDVEYRTLGPGGQTRWVNAVGRFHYGPDGTPTRFDGITLDISARKAHEEEIHRLAGRERFLAELAERARGLTEPEEVIADAVRSVGGFLGVSRCIFADIDIEADTCTISPAEYQADPSVASIAGVVPISAFGSFVVAEYAARREVAVDDVRLDPVRVPPETVAAYEAIGIRAHITVPVVHSDRVVSCISVHNAAPRRWDPEEVDLLRAVVERTWLTVEVTRQNRALLRGAEERREAHERTVSILESITEAFFAVDAGFRFTYVNREAERLWGRPREDFLGRPFLEMLPQMAGSASFARHERVMTERVPLHFETLSPVIGRWVEINIYPTADGGLSAFFRDISERKALDDERERVAERERNIAQQLQTALQPELPGAVPGLALTKYYKAALAEAGVGGDFYDVFAVEKGRTALVVGDLSGKGLAAAAQVSVVRNMLRAFLYSRPTVAEAVAELNRVLAENNLLSGFTTLFVGTYDGATRLLKYVNCGQEPALVRRADTGAVEPLDSTGPILGTIEGVRYAESCAVLAPGDALAIFTDGLTEVGAFRTDMLGVEGVAALLAGPLTGAGSEQKAAALAMRLIAGVDGFAQSSARDDICLLVAVVDGG